MPPTEHEILTQYLLVTAQLPSIVSLQEFAALFPRALQSSPSIRGLYRDLQSQRNAVVDAVAQSIDEEARQGRAMRRAVIQARRRDAERLEERDEEVEIERMLGNWSDAHRNNNSSSSSSNKHSLESILPEMESAVGELEAELQLLQEEEAALLASVQQTVGAMSDLRYGRLANSQLPEQVLDGLANLEEICKAKH
ncbi:hypothetical protein VTJ83DRAFT_6836 [Remersonia thermophila]|uniref:Cnl2/NKP2 family protein n=1 Tax=Remersonia thermophila TaxID=72144 RepID=A0ABR4D5V7_9PEZI